MDINETIFREAMFRGGHAHYICDLMSGAPLSSVADDYVMVTLHKCFAALVCGHGLWRRGEGTEEAEADLTKASVSAIADQLGQMAVDTANLYAGQTMRYRPSDHTGLAAVGEEEERR